MAEHCIPILLATAWLLPLASFVALVFWGPRMGRHGHASGYVATAAIMLGFVLSATSLVIWLAAHPLTAGEHAKAAAPIAGDWYTLAQFGGLTLTIGYYIDALTIAMFTMVTLVASCIHVYSFGYMHEELHEVTDSLVTLSNGEPLRRRGRFSRFYQYLSLFCFSMLGLVIAGNLAMVFAFWELVGICSYFLIGFYIERKSASNAANKAFIVNRVGDFGMIIGLMAIWAGLGTFSFGDYTLTMRDGAKVTRPGIFQQVRPREHDYQPRVPEGMAAYAAEHCGSQAAGNAASPAGKPLGYWLLVVAGLGVFCGCVGKSAQFPLHVWLPDAMEGPTPVSALIHAATMVAAGVYLVARFYPVFTPEVLLVIAYVGCITLFIAATIAITATDIKRVLAYSTVSQLGYMMLALGIGGWLAGIFHLFTHAFFKALLFLGSGSVIHATGTNEMPRMGGLLKKMPWTAGTMLIGCLAIAGAGLPVLLPIGTSGYYSKDLIIGQGLSFMRANPQHGILFWAAVSGAGITAFYMFRMWYMTFIGRPRDEHVHHHAHESPRTMVAPLVVLAALALGGGWTIFGFGLQPLLEQARPQGFAEGASAGWEKGDRHHLPERPEGCLAQMVPVPFFPSEHLLHTPEIHHAATLWAFSMALAGFLLATAFYGLRVLDAEDVRRQFAPLHRFLVKKWYFDELYALIWVRPTLRIAGWIAAVDKQGIDRLADGAAHSVTRLARLDDWIDRLFVDGLVNLTARLVHAAGVRLRAVQTGNVRQYVMWLALATVLLFVLANVFWNYQ
jgi:proton-translocating NADH-quinone oxidoreductase chain L